MHDFTRRSLLQGGTALAAAGALTGPALLEFAKAWAQTSPWKAAVSGADGSSGRAMARLWPAEVRQRAHSDKQSWLRVLPFWLRKR